MLFLIKSVDNKEKQCYNVNIRNKKARIKKMKTVKEFNKEFVKEILKLQEKRKDFFSKKIEKYCLEKNLKIKKTEDNFEIVNVDYVEDLLRNNKLKLINEYEHSIYLIKVKIYKFEELRIIIEESNNNKNYKVFLEEALIDLRDWDSDYESLEDFLEIYL